MDKNISIMEALKKVAESIKAWTLKNIQNTIPKYTTISLLAENWIADSLLYYQDIALDCVTENSMVNLQPNQMQLASWQDDGLAFTTYSSDGSVRVYVIGGLPEEDYIVQATIQEVIEV